jgi:hypothetical protein
MGTARAQSPVEPSATAAVTSEREAPRFAIGARAAISPITGFHGGFLWGLDASYRLHPLFAVGLEYEDTIIIDNGNDKQYCDGCLDSMRSARPFAELRPLGDGRLYPFVRASAGLAWMKILDGSPDARPGGALGAAAGGQGTLGPLYVRVFFFATALLGAGQSVVGSNQLAGVAFELGAVF